MIHILTQNPKIRDQLSALLSELDHEFIFHDELEPLEKTVRRLTKRDHVFYDLHLEDILWAFERLYTACKKTNLVAFEQLTNETSLENNQCPAGVENYLLLPSNRERGKTRLQTVLRDIAQKATTRKKARKKKPTPRAKQKPTAESTAQTLTSIVEVSTPTIARYLQTRSPVMRALLSEIQAAAETDSIIVIEGDEGAEFELLAREINFRSNGDAAPLHIMDPMQLDNGELKSLLNPSEGEESPQYVYMGLTADWTTKAADEIENFIEAYDALDSTSLRIIFGHATDSETYFPESVRVLVKSLRKRGHPINIPGMSDRREDIPMIAYTVFSTLRMAHPFLRTRVLSTSAVRFLQSECDALDYARLTRVIRNAMALGKQDNITEETLRNLGDNSPMTQHLIESLADEQYFKSAGE